VEFLTLKILGELNQKESPRLKWGAKILNKMGIKTITTESSIKIFGNPNLKINKKIIIKDYLKDHRVFMTSVIAASVFGGTWNIHDKDSIKTSFPTFIDIVNRFKKIMIKRKNIIKIAIDSPAACWSWDISKSDF
jgi:3-phosphoshikimate 1-carboxyvinyltransferase